MIKVKCNFANRWEFYDNFDSVTAFRIHVKEKKLVLSQYKMFCKPCDTELAMAIQAKNGRMRMDKFPTCPTCRKEIW